MSELSPLQIRTSIDQKVSGGRFLFCLTLLLPGCGTAEPQPGTGWTGSKVELPCRSATWYADTDGDGFGDASVPSSACEQPYGYVSDNTDCDDDRSDSHPGGVERCDGFDQDCTGTADDGVPPGASVWYLDSDGDGYGSAWAQVLACTAPAGHVADSTDCDDHDAAVNPDALEACGDPEAPLDEDCDGTIDDLDDPVSGRTPWFPDADGDGYGEDIAPEWFCVGPAGFVGEAGDCDDTDAELGPMTWYPDADEDGFGDVSDGQVTCPRPDGWVADSTDCDDHRQDVSPADPEQCADPADEDCDGMVGEAGAGDCTWWYPDADRDGYGGESGGACSCGASTALPSAVGDDCDDADATVHPGAPPASTCDGTDSDCDGVAYCDLGAVTAEYTGVAAGDGSGTSVSAVPDLDGDGVEELLIAAPGSRRGAGAVYVVSDPADLGASLAASAGRFSGASLTDGAGETTLGCDLDQDGVGDIVIAAPGHDGPEEAGGGVFLWYAPEMVPTELLAADAMVLGLAGDELASSMVCGSDVDDDGFRDLVLGAPNAGAGGAVYLIDDPFGELSPTDAAATVSGGVGAGLGAGVAAGDLDGDGVDDLVVSAPGVSGLGAVYVLRGPFSGALDAELAETRFVGDGVNTGEHVSLLGDTDGNGLPDLAIASTDSPWAAVVRSTSPGTWALADAPLTVTLSAAPGMATLLGADLDGDGAPELVIGTGADPAVYVFAASGTGALADADALGVADNRTAGEPGGGVARLADRDGDGADELLIGAPLEDGSGVAWILQGRYSVP